MRYREIIENIADPGAKASAEVWKQTKRSSEALRKLRSKQQDAQDAKAAARQLANSPEKQRRIAAADRREADARHSYNDTLASANDRARAAMAKVR